MKKSLLSMAALLLGALTQVAVAHDGGCDQCGCQQKIRKICRAVCETKKVKVTSYSCECEEICIAGRTKTHDCVPGCGRARTIKRLVKRETTKEVPSYKWVVEYLCEPCASDCQEVAPQGVTPAAPPAAASVGDRLLRN